MAFLRDVIGNIRYAAEIDTEGVDRGLSEMERKVRASHDRLENVRATTEVGADIKEVEAKTKRVKALMRDLEREKATLDIGVDDERIRRVNAALRGLRIERDRIFKTQLNLRQELDAAAAADELHVTRVEVEKTGNALTRFMTRVRDSDHRLVRWGRSLATIRLHLGFASLTIKQFGIALATLGPIIEGLIGSITALVGSVGRALVGALTTGGAAMTAFGLSAAGVGLVMGPLIKSFGPATDAVEKYDEAVKEFGKDSKEAKEAQKEMNRVLSAQPRAVREAIKGAQELGDAWSRRTRGAQKPFYDTINEGLKTARTLLRPFARESVATFRVLSRETQEWLRGLRSPESQRILTTLMREFRQALPPLMEGLGDFGTALGRIFAVASRQFEPLARGFRDWARGLEEWSRNGRAVTSWFRETISHTRQLWHFLRQTGDLLGTVLGGGADEGRNLLQTLTRLFREWDAFLETTRGQNEMREWFAEAGQTTRALGSALGRLIGLFSDIAEVTQPWVEGLLKGFGALLDGLSKIIDFLGDDLVRALGIAAGVWLGAKWLGVLSLLRNIGLALGVSTAGSSSGLIGLLRMIPPPALAAATAILGIGLAIKEIKDGLPHVKALADEISNVETVDADFLLDRDMADLSSRSGVREFIAMAKEAGQTIKTSMVKGWIEAGDITAQEGRRIIRELRDVRQETTKLEQQQARRKGFGIAQRLATDGRLMRNELRRITDTFALMEKPARDAAIRSMVAMTRSLEQHRDLPEGATRKLVNTLERRFGDIPRLADVFGKRTNQNWEKHLRTQQRDFDRYSEWWSRDVLSNVKGMVGKAGNELAKWIRANKGDFGKIVKDGIKATEDLRAGAGSNIGGLVNAAMGGLGHMSGEVNKALKSLGVKKQVYETKAYKGMEANRADLPNKQRGGAVMPQLAGGGFGGIVPGRGSGDKVLTQAMTEPGEGLFVMNRNAMGHLMRWNSMFPRHAAGGMVDPSWDPGSERLAASISDTVGGWAKRYNADMTAGYDPGGGHVSPGHNVTGTATDMIPAGGDWNLLERGLRAIEGSVNQVLYGTNGVGTPYPNHGRGNHAHIEWGGHPTVQGAIMDGIKRVVIDGPAGPYLEGAQASLDLYRKHAQQFIAKHAGSLGGGDLMSGDGEVKRVFAQVAKRLSTSKTATLALGMAGFAESGMRDLSYGHSTSQGALQLLSSTASGMGIDPHNEGQIASAFLLRGYYGKGGANKLAEDGLPAHLVAQGVQGSAFASGSNYAAMRGPAEGWMREYGLKGGGKAPGKRYRYGSVSEGRADRELNMARNDVGRFRDRLRDVKDKIPEAQRAAKSGPKGKRDEARKRVAQLQADQRALTEKLKAAQRRAEQAKINAKAVRHWNRRKTQMEGSINEATTWMDFYEGGGADATVDAKDQRKWGTWSGRAKERTQKLVDFLKRAMRRAKGPYKAELSAMLGQAAQDLAGFTGEFPTEEEEWAMSAVDAAALEKIEMDQALAALTTPTTDDQLAAQQLVRFWEAQLASRRSSGAPMSAITEAAQNLLSAREAVGQGAGGGTAAPTIGEQLVSFNQARYDMFKSYGGNAARVTPGLGATGGINSPVASAGYTTPGKTVTVGSVNNYFPTPPPDPHTWSQQQAFELEVL